MPFKLVIWDFDGTLVDSLTGAVAIFNKLAPELGHKPVEDVAKVRAMTMRQFLRQHGVSFWRLPRLVRRFRAAAAEEADQLQMFAGLSPLLAGLHSDGVRLGILSSNHEDNIRRALRTSGAEQYFAFVVGYPKLFGKGRALKRIMRAERLERSDVLYIGDEVRDVEAARKAGIAVAAVTWGFHAESLLRAYNPDHLVTEPAQLTKIVGKQEMSRG